MSGRRCQTADCRNHPGGKLVNGEIVEGVLCDPCERGIEDRNQEHQELGTRKLGTRTPSLNAFLVPSSRSEPGRSPRVPSSELQERIVADIRRLRTERSSQGKPEPVPYALSWVVRFCGARDKAEAKRAIDALLEAGRLEIAYTLTQTRTRCYVLRESAS